MLQVGSGSGSVEKSTGSGSESSSLLLWQVNPLRLALNNSVWSWKPKCKKFTNTLCALLIENNSVSLFQTLLTFECPLQSADISNTIYTGEYSAYNMILDQTVCQTWTKSGKEINICETVRYEESVIEEYEYN